MRSSKYLLAIVWLAVLIGAGAINSIQRVSATPYREACVTEVELLSGNPDVMTNNTVLASVSISNAVICLFQSEPDAPEIRECVAEVERMMVKPGTTFVEITDTLSNAVICLAQSAPEREKCVAEVERTTVKPDAIINTLSNAVICLAK